VARVFFPRGLLGYCRPTLVGFPPILTSNRELPRWPHDAGPDGLVLLIPIIFECPKGNHIQVLKNANQMTLSINTARPVLITSSAIIDGPNSAWRASLGVSMIVPCFLIGMTLSLKFWR
jgi:hypothetical protein